jgi:hypothetical protein
MGFDVAITGLVAIAQFVMGYLAYQVTVTPLSSRSTKKKRRYTQIFVGCGVITIVAVSAATVKSALASDSYTKQLHVIETRSEPSLGDLTASVVFSVACQKGVWFQNVCDAQAAPDVQQPSDFGEIQAFLTIVKDAKPGATCSDNISSGSSLLSLDLSGNSTGLLHDAGRLEVRADRMVVRSRRMPHDGLRSELSVPGARLFLTLKHGANSIPEAAISSVILTASDGTRYFAYGPYHRASNQYSEYCTTVSKYE